MTLIDTKLVHPGFELIVTQEHGEDNSILEAREPIMLKLHKALQAFAGDVAMDSFKVEQIEETPPTFKYTYTTKDEREWRQDIIASSADPMMTFNVTDPWRLSEFRLHREVRDLVVELLWERNVVEIKASWE